MFEHVKIQSLNDFFVKMENRSGKGIYFYRINGYNAQIGEFISRYYEAARASGVVIEGRIPNPDQKNLAYYSEIMGGSFELELSFLKQSLRKWLPRMKEYQQKEVAASLYDTLMLLKKAGKNENMLKNAYIKFMCWMYYRFERVLHQLGSGEVPKILYEGELSIHEFLLIQILAKAGCDVVLLQYAGDENYRKLDPEAAVSECLQMPEMHEFPSGFCVEQVRRELQRKIKNERLYGKKPEIQNCTNAWISGKGLADFMTAISLRGTDPKLFYNCFCRMTGTEDKCTYLNELYQFALALKAAGRRTVIVEQEISRAEPEEIRAVKRETYQETEDMIGSLSKNIRCAGSLELEKLFRKVFVDLMLEEAASAGASLNKLTNKAVILLCWFLRYQEKLFGGWKMPEVGCFIYMGGCRDANEALFLRFLARLPVDVLILVPDLNRTCCLQDSRLYEIHYPESLSVHQFPRENGALHMETAARHAENELNEILYQNSGLYRSQQYGKANAITLKTTCEEIALYWKEELKYRPHFSEGTEAVNIPVIFAKVSGVKNKDLKKYWEEIRALQTEDTYLIRQAPFLTSTDENPLKPYAAEFFKNGKLQKKRIREHKLYPYGVLREEIQEHILEKLQQLIDLKLIKGTFENGTEYTIVATILNMKLEIIRMLQKFDFTKVNPKIVYIHTTEKEISLEDAILMAFLNLAGFDIVFFVPTGYQNVEKYFQTKLLEEHQAGEYVYDLQVPDFGTVSTNVRQTWCEKIFRRIHKDGT